MARLEEHENDCLKYLGKKYTEVHLWLDEMAAKYPPHIFDDQHRKYRHNYEGIQKIKKMWGNKASKAAMIHIIKDLVGYIPEVFNIGEEQWNEKTKGGKERV